MLYGVFGAVMLAHDSPVACTDSWSKTTCLASGRSSCWQPTSQFPTLKISHQECRADCLANKGGSTLLFLVSAHNVLWFHSRSVSVLIWGCS